MITSCEGLADSVIAVDGAYALFPNGVASSDPRQREVIETTADACGMDCRVHVPSTVWRGNEVQKRSYLFRFALETATHDRDWFLIMDGDQVVECMHSADVRKALAETDRDVALALSRCQADAEDIIPHRSFFRAVPGLKVERAHFNYTAWRHGRKMHMWHVPPGMEGVSEPALDLTAHMLIRHRTEPRPARREQARETYYTTRDRLRVERVNR